MTNNITRKRARQVIAKAAASAASDVVQRDAWGEVILAKVTDRMNLMRARDYDRERGDVFYISSTHNDYQWVAGLAFDVDTARRLRDALTVELDRCSSGDSVALGDI